MKPLFALLVTFALPAAAADLVCTPSLTCSDEVCFSFNGDVGEDSEYVRNPMGDTPEIYLGEGQWLAATRVEEQGALRWLAQTPMGDTILLSASRADGNFMMIRRESGGAGRLHVSTGQCEDRA